MARSDILTMESILVINAKAKDIAGFPVRRALPAIERRMIGPFVFLDQMGPTQLAPGQRLDVRPHPHIGLSTMTYLFEGEILHRDSLGTVQTIQPGAINWMTAGRGVVHSERVPETLRAVPRRSHGLQLWVALPPADEESEPTFSHTPEHAIPRWEQGGVRARVLVGHAFGMDSPVPTRSPTLYVDLQLARGATLTLPADAARERALYVVDGACRVDDEALPPHTTSVDR